MKGRKLISHICQTGMKLLPRTGLLLQGTGAWLRGTADDSIRRAGLSFGVGENFSLRPLKKEICQVTRKMTCVPDIPQHEK